MGVRDTTLELFREGLSPRQISDARSVSLKTTLGYLNDLVGQGRIRRSDIYFSIPSAIRRQVQDELSAFEGDDRQFLWSFSRRNGAALGEDAAVVVEYGGARSAYGDMYQDLRGIEIYLHQLVREVLSGSDQVISGRDWWNLVPVAVREECMRRKVADRGSASHPYAYTTLLELKDIISANWQVVERALRKSDEKYFRHNLLTDLDRLNEIRKIVMHPVRGDVPSEGDFEFVRLLQSRLGIGGLHGAPT